MIKVLPESQGNLLVVRAEGKLTGADYRDVIVPRLRALIRDHGQVRYLLDDFDGWQVAALWEDARFAMAHRSDFEKIGLVGGPAWVVWALKLIALLMRGEIKTYSRGAWDEALRWIET